MATVISNDSIERHNVHKYNFRVIALGVKDEEPTTQEPTINIEPQLENEEIDSSALSSGSKSSLIESLMKKTDEMSSNFIKLQMKLEEKEQEFETQLQKVKEEAFAEGLETGAKQTQEHLQEELKTIKQLYNDSVKKLEESASEFKSSIESLKSELVLAAINIAHEVIKVEVSQNSNEIAKKLCDELIKDLQGAAKITIKVNPKDHGAISQHVGALENITVLSDSAISEGGVVVLSDAGNVDSQIQKRFERVKKAALSE